MRTVIGADGRVVKDGAATPDGDLVNTAYPLAGPHPPSTATAQLVPPFDGPTIGDRLAAPLGSRDAAAADLTNAFAFNQ